MDRLLDCLKVESHWLPGQPVNWYTGDHQADERPKSTHCSAYVASIAARLNIPLLRPPQHSQVLLANAQNRWLHQQPDWTLITSSEAINRANDGQLVLASYLNPSGQAGHIAVVIPSQELMLVTQAGNINYRSVPFEQVFRHPDQVDFFAHTVTSDQLQHALSTCP